MKLRSPRRLSPCLLITLALFVAGSSAIEAAPPWKWKRDHRSSHSSHSDPHWGHYHSSPRSGFRVSFGVGYAGRGYYYGPPGASYYYQRPGVVYYRTRSLVPRYYLDDGYTSSSLDASVQRELRRRGYYRGPIDGDIGPGTRRAIARFEADHRMPVRGDVSRQLLRALGLR